MDEVVRMSGLLLLSLLTLTSALDCNQTASPVNYIAFPTTFGDTPVITPSTPGCAPFRDTNSEFQCDYSVILGDGVMVPSPPDLNSEDYLRHFITWERSSTQHYVDFDLSGVSITAIELSFLNSPANGISLPDLQLFRVDSYDKQTFTADSTTPIPTVLVDNQDLTQTDNQIRTVALPSAVAQSGRFRIAFEFTMFHNFDWFFLSEVRFCTELQPLFRFGVVLQAPSSTVQPSADDLRGGSTELVCTVPDQGPYTWQWEKDNSMIGNGDPNYDITIGDGTRTTKLKISNLNFSHAGQYKCTATTMDLTNLQSTGSLTQEIQFPEIISAPDVSGYLQTGEVTLTCELHGYQSSFSPPVWLNTSGSKYTISSSDGVNTIVLENGTTLPSVVVSLIVHSLTSADEGDYTCRGTRGESVSQLTIQEASPIIPPLITTTTTTGDAYTQVKDAPTKISDQFVWGLTIIVGLAIGGIACSVMITAIVIKKRRNSSTKSTKAESLVPYSASYEIISDGSATVLVRNKAYIFPPPGVETSQQYFDVASIDAYEIVQTDARILEESDLIQSKASTNEGVRYEETIENECLVAVTAPLEIAKKSGDSRDASVVPSEASSIDSERTESESTTRVITGNDEPRVASIVGSLGVVAMGYEAASRETPADGN